MFTKKIGIDLGTANTVVFVPGKGFVINEPTIVALTKPENSVLAVGVEAKEMIGRTPEEIVAYRPLKDGVVADYYITKAMLTYFISKAIGWMNVMKPDVVISVPAGITQTERRAVVNAAKEGGARNAFIVREPILAALGAGIPINARSGNMIINIGGGTSEVAVIALGNIISWASLRIAGNKFDQAISDYVKKKYALAIGEQTAENVKIEIGSAIPTKDKKEYQLRGRDLVTGLPKDIVINSNEIAEALHPLLMEIAGSIQNVFNVTPPELVADIMEKGIILSGGSVQLHNMSEFLERFLGVQVYVAEDPLFCVAKGTGLILSHLDTYKRTLLNKR
ncbi:MAG: rod shape-determining protein [Candidatus Liptonbacteria bacterium RIFCSPLOWO2_01_FULL_52_25]|uniref:Cell shape-determining protein MreB n=1 Tax=Candidatus Liptonbacteria bacterium RIFCSPLOWO2_01_FULL_52_25 TaxID=1798650 RepID=A0A1G2CF60_9BACT|nr:MAG: rod shape-determining protein [Candidatus Liptonbacteria bacterium RIFCSPLOWO2_01_FULL_52_25]